MTKTTVIYSDTQLPFEDRKAVQAVTRFIGEFQPDEVVHIGDLMDFPQPSRWSKGTASEFEGSVFEDCEYAKKKFLQPLRNVYDGPVGVIEGNHDLRPRTYLDKYSPALAESSAFNVENLLDFAGFGITKLPDFYAFAPGWVMTHGHLGKISISQIAGQTAMRAATKFGVSVIMGHTHRLGMISSTEGYDGNVTRELTGLEVGNLMDMKQAKYLGRATGNWQKGFAIVRVDGNHVKAETVKITGNRFMVDGNTYTI